VCVVCVCGVCVVCVCVCGTGQNQTTLMSILMQILKLYLRLSNCASVGGKNFDNGGFS